MTLKPVDTAIVMVVGPCIDDTDFKSLEEAIAYNAAGMDVSLIVEKTDGTTSVTAITLTTGGTSDWTHKDGAYYEVEVTATQNAEEGIAYIRGVCTGVLPFESPRYEIVKANIYNSWVKGTDTLQTDLIQIGGIVQSLTDFKDMIDTGYDPSTHKIQSDLIYIHGTALTETSGQLAAGFKKLFDVTTPLLVASDVMRGTDSAALATSALTNVTWTDTKAGYLNHSILSVSNMVSDIQADTDELQTDWANGGRLDLILDIIAADTTTDIPALIATAQNDLDNPAQYKADVSSLALEATLTAMKGGTFNGSTDSLEEIRNRGDSAWITGAGTPDRLLMIDTTIATLSSQTSFTLTDGSTDNTAYNNCTIIIEDASTSTQKAMGIVSNYVGSTKTITLKYDPAIFTMANTDKVYILAENALKATLANRQLNVASDGDIGGNIDGIISELGVQAKLDVNAECDTALTDYGANTTTPPTVTQIRAEMDTNSTKMAPSQVLADYKATGFSTHTAANVWESVTRSLTDKSGFALSTTGIKAIWDQLTSALTTVGSIGKLLVDNINATISSRNSTVPDVAGTAATLHGVTDGKIDVVDTIIDAIKSKTDNLPSGIAKNEALPKFDFLMVLSSDHISGATGKTVTGQISKDGGAFTTITNAITEVSGGMYTIASGFTQTEMNANVITLQFSEGTCDTRTLTLITN